MHRILLITAILSAFLISSANTHDFSRHGLSYISHINELCPGSSRQSWVIKQAPNGFIYFANNSGLVEHNGTSSTLYPSSNNSIVRALHIDSTGRIFIGCTNEFGYFEPGPNGILQYTNLSNIFELTDFGVIWDIVEHNNGIYFISYQKNIIFKYHNNQVIEIKLPPFFSRTKGFNINNRFFLYDKNAGLATLKNDTIYRYHTETFIDDALSYSLLPVNDTQLLLATRLQGLYTIDITQLKPLSHKESFTQKPVKFKELKNIYQPYNNTPTNDTLSYSEIFHGMKMPNGHYCFSTLKSGIFFVDKTGNILSNFFLNKGLIDNSVSCSYLDRDQNIWIATRQGISIIRLTPGLRTFNSYTKINGNILNSTTINNRLFIGTTAGLYIVKDEVFNPPTLFPLPNNDLYIRYLYRYINNSENGIILSTTQNTYFCNLQTEQVTKIELPHTCYLIKQYIADSSIFFSCHAEGIDILKKPDQNSWRMNTVGTVLDNYSDITKIECDAKGKIYVSTAFSGLATIEIPDKKTFSNAIITKYNSSNGLPQDDKNTWVLHNDSLYVITAKGIYTATPSTIKGQPELRFAESKTISDQLQYKGHITDIAFTEDNILAGTPDGIIKYDIADKALTNKIFFRLKNTYINSIQTDGDNTWILTSSDLIYQNKQYDPRKTLEPKLYFTKICFGEHCLSSDDTSNVIYAGNIAAANNSLSVQVTCPSFLGIGKNKFSYFIEGFDKTWSELTANNNILYRYIPPGDYTLHVTVTNGLGISSDIKSVVFTISPKWYQSWYAYIIYIILFILLLLRIIKLYTANLINNKRKLETAIKKAIEDVETQKEKVIKQRNDILRQHRDITRSIEYAKNIQKAIFKSSNYLKQLFTESFVINKPRDIVSGDFIWCHSTDNYSLVVVADCTGHGVPGAFMSIIGANFLTEIVISDKCYMPDQIINKLRTNIITTLHQSTDNFQENKDGMDLAIVLIDKKNNLMHYSGANNSIYISNNNNKIIRVIPDKMPVGVFFTNDPFSLQTFAVNDISNVYMLSDGYLDQFGEKTGRKITSKRFVEVLENIQHLSMSQQKEFLIAYIENWKRDIPQTDDILVAGFTLQT